MNWVDVTWPMLAAASLVLGLVHALVWLGRPHQVVHLAFATAATSVGLLALQELAAFNATTTSSIATTIRWMHVPVAFLVWSLIYIVHDVFGRGAVAIAFSAASLRLLALVLNFTTGVNLNFLSVDALGHSNWWGAQISHPIGVVNPAIIVAQLSNLLLLAYFGQTLYRVAKDRGSTRGIALLVCGAWLLLIVLMMVTAAALAMGVPRMPLIAAPSFVIIVSALSYRLAADLFHSQDLASRLHDSEQHGLGVEKHLELAASASGLGLWHWDLVRGQFRENANNSGLLGNIGEAEDGAALFRNADPDGDLVRREFENVIRSASYELEYQIRKPGGAMRWISLRGSVEHDKQGAPVSVRGVTQDVTQRRKEENLLRTLLESAPSALLLADQDGIVRYANAESSRLFGYAGGDMVGLQIRKLMPHLARLGQVDDVAAAPLQRASRASELVGMKAQGEAFPIEAVVCPLEIDEQAYHLAAVTDLSTRQRIEHEIALEREAVAHLSRVTMLGELSGSLAHELNQPLAAILSNAQAAQRILRRDPSEVQEVMEILADIVDNDRRAGQVITRIRSLLKKEVREHVPLDINEVVVESMRLMRNDLLNRRVTCRLELAPGLPHCLADRVQLQQVVLNLVLNACDALPEAPAERVVHVRTVRSEGGVRTEVVDNGVGIAPDMLERIFTPFETTKSSGMGMGLAVCRTIVSAHGGRIWAENIEPLGAKVCFDIPRQE